MLIPKIKNKKRREFTFTPFVYQPPEEEGLRQGSSRIKFNRIRHSPVLSPNSIRIKIILVVLLFLALYYFRGLIVSDEVKVRIEDLKIEESPIIFK